MAEQQSPGTRAERETRTFRDVIEGSESFSLPEAAGGAMVEFVGRIQRWEQGRFVLLLPPHDDWGVLAVELDIADVHEAEPIFEDSAGRSSYRVLVPSGSLVKLVFRAPDLVARLVAQRDRPEMPEPLAPWRVDLGRRDPDPYAPAGTGPHQQRPYGQPAAPPAHQQQPYSTLPGLQQDADYYPEPVPRQRARYGPAGHDPAYYQPHEAGYHPQQATYGPAGHDHGLYQPYQAEHDPGLYQPHETGPYAQPVQGQRVRYGPAGRNPARYDTGPYPSYQAGHDPGLYQPYEAGYHPQQAAYGPGGHDPAQYDTGLYQPYQAGHDPAHYQHSEPGTYGPASHDPAQYDPAVHGHGTPSQYDQYTTGEYDSTYPDQHDPYR